MLRRSILPAILLAACLIALPFGYARVREHHLRNVRVVEEGVLYRSGQPSPAGLGRLVHDLNIRMVICFRDVEEGKADVAPDQWEEAYCANLGINYVRMPLRVWSYDQGVIPADENVRRFLAIMADPKNHPVLIHCFRGVHRTGTYSAIYRMERQGWSNEEAIEELKALGYYNLDREDDVRMYLERYVPGSK
ncbi:MAG TPA: tyrosine-protein phosphatase [Gemmataceae bacterium]|jgi:protein tyrosine/serine phosphatase|nr:tyrosine-protein phosphatase [Gemmataceae bacterium]